MRFRVFVPGHISCFFSVYYDADPLKSGSYGGGILLDKGVITDLKKSSNDEISVKINGKKYEGFSIAKKTAEYMLKKFQITETITINQEFNLPIGAGFGTSASSAIGVAIAINDLFNLNINRVKLYQIAHIMEIKYSTGLGDVISETSKGLIIRKKPGAPGFGELINMVHDDLFVITKTFGEIHTKSIIKNPQIAEKINNLGINTTKNFLHNPTIDNLLKSSLEFAEKTSLISPEVLDTINELNKYTLGSSMVMLGNTVFALSYTPEEDLKNINSDGFLISKVNNHGLN
jgi:pantoate kinase